MPSANCQDKREDLANRQEMEVGATRKWTLLYYMNGDNNLREHVSLDMVRIHTERVPPDMVAVAQLYRGEEQWSWKNLANKLSSLREKKLPPAFSENWRGCRTFVVDGQGTQQFDGPQEARVSDPASLKKFLIDSMTQFPSENFALFLDTHGDKDGTLLRDSLGNAMTAEQLRQTLSDVRRETGHKISILALQACSLGHPATVATLEGCADFLIASTNKIPAGKANNHHLMRRLRVDPDHSPAHVADHILKNYQENMPGFQLFPAPVPEGVSQEAEPGKDQG